MEINVKPGERVRVFKRAFSSVPMDYEFEAKATNEGEEPLGTVEVVGSSWVFPKAPEPQPLQCENSVHAGVWDTFFSVYVVAENAITVTVPKRRWAAMGWVIWIAVAIVFLATLPFLFNFGGP